MIPIQRVTGQNMPGLCTFHVVDVRDVLVMPPVVNGVVTQPVVLKTGKIWHVVEVAPPGSRFHEPWSTPNGQPVAASSVTGFVGKDELAKLTALWSLTTTRFLVLCTGRNGDVLLMGTKEEGCRGIADTRERGDEDEATNGYQLTFSVRRREPVPFYLQAVGPVIPAGCPGLAELLQTTTLSTLLGALPPTLIEQLQELFGGEGCPTLVELVALASNTELFAALSNDQAIYIAEQVIEIVDGGGAADPPGGEPPPPPAEFEFDADDFDPNDFET